MELDTVAVIGAGTMGSGIAQVFLQNGFSVVLVDRDEEQLKTARERIDEGLRKLVEKDDLNEEGRESSLDALVTTEDMASVETADIILEAVPEELDIKAAVFEEAAEHNKGAIYASNTSSIPIRKIAAHVPDASRCLGLHFFNPAPVMDIIELVVTKETDEDVKGALQGLGTALGKEVSTVRDVPGFVSNRILMPFINEAARTLENGIATKESIDLIAKKGFNHPLGPLELADFIGLDVCLDIMDRMYEETEEERFAPVELLEELVSEGKLGRKSGEGFYEYDG